MGVANDGSAGVKGQILSATAARPGPSLRMEIMFVVRVGRILGECGCGNDEQNCDKYNGQFLHQVFLLAFRSG
jgi:hypothetical protein